MRPALLALDFDGTVAEAGVLVPGVVGEVAAWRACGVRVAVFTARWQLPAGVTELGPVVTTRCYGAVVEVGEMRKECPLPPGSLAVALEDIRAHLAGSRTLVLTDAYCYTNVPQQAHHRPLETLPPGDPVLKVQYGHPDPSRVDEVAGSWQPLPDVQMIRERATACVLVARGADKGAALAFAATQLGVALSAVLAAGDGESDAALMREAGAFLRVGAHPALASAHWSVTSPLELPDQLAALRSRLLASPP